MHLFLKKAFDNVIQNLFPGERGGEICQERWSRRRAWENERERERANGKRGGALSRGRGIARGQQQGIRGRPSPIQGEPSLCVGSGFSQMKRTHHASVWLLLARLIGMQSVFFPKWLYLHTGHDGTSVF